MFNALNTRLAALCALAVAILAGPTAALAQSNTSYSTLTSAVDWSNAITAIMAVAALLAGVLVVRKGIRFVLGMIR
jgi:uncharacterized protein HemY